MQVNVPATGLLVNVLLGKGDHEITSSWTSQNGSESATTLCITRSNLTFAGKGKDTTTILGGFGIHELENITFKQMTVTQTQILHLILHIQVKNVNCTPTMGTTVVHQVENCPNIHGNI